MQRRKLNAASPSKRRRQITIDRNQPVLPQLNEALPHSHHCHSCRRLWQCDDPACTVGLSRLCTDCTADVGVDVYADRPESPGERDRRVTDTLLP